MRLLDTVLLIKFIDSIFKVDIMSKKFLLVICTLLPILGGCVAAVIGGGGGFVMAVEDRRTIGTITEDNVISHTVSGRIGETEALNHVNVLTFNRTVLLTGEAASQTEKDLAERIAKGVQNVVRVYNELQIAMPSSTRSRLNDNVISTTINARFFSEGKFKPVWVKVTTDNGVVYLMGSVKKAEAESATRIAQSTKDVKKVVRLFEYLD
jgi:hypothetical protein